MYVCMIRRAEQNVYGVIIYTTRSIRMKPYAEKRKKDGSTWCMERGQTGWMDGWGNETRRRTHKQTKQTKKHTQVSKYVVTVHTFIHTSYIHIYTIYIYNKYIYPLSLCQWIIFPCWRCACGAMISPHKGQNLQRMREQEEASTLLTYATYNLSRPSAHGWEGRVR